MAITQANQMAEPGSLSEPLTDTDRPDLRELSRGIVGNTRPLVLRITALGANGLAYCLR